MMRKLLLKIKVYLQKNDYKLERKMGTKDGILTKLKIDIMKFKKSIKKHLMVL